MVVWAAVLVPMWLRRHDAVTESRSVDRFSTAMRVLSRRSPYGGGTRYVVMPRRDAATCAAQVSTPQRPPRRPTAEAPGVRRTPQDARARLREQRRQVLAVLLAVTGLLLVLALAGVVSWGLALLATVLLGGYVVHLRVQVVRTMSSARARPRPVDRSAVPVEGSPTSGPDATVDAAFLGAPLAGSELAAEPAPDGRWEPVPVPLPTYVTAPVAPPRARREPLLQPPASDPFQPEDAEIEVLFERRWAVND